MKKRPKASQVPKKKKDPRKAGKVNSLDSLLSIKRRMKEER